MIAGIALEAFNLGEVRADVVAGLGARFAALAPQLAGAPAQIAAVAVTYPEAAALGAVDRAALEARLAFLGGEVRWIAMPRAAGYYDHKQAAVAALADVELVAFLDGDCAPDRGWLAAMLAPIVRGDARVVAGATTYPGALATIANRLDFPYVTANASGGVRAFGISRTAPDGDAVAVRNFFANNVAFARAAFVDAGGYPTLPDLFHGHCQVLALRLAARGETIRFAPTARVAHAWPDSAHAFVVARLLRGADARNLIPYVARAYLPRGASITRALGPLPALALLGARALVGTRDALVHGPRARGLALVAGLTALDALGAVAARAVHRHTLPGRA